MSTPCIDRAQAQFELHFEPLGDADAAATFPCDEDGRVDMDAMAESMLNNYLFARAVIGHQFWRPQIRVVASAPKVANEMTGGKRKYASTAPRQFY